MSQTIRDVAVILTALAIPGALIIYWYFKREE
jgi:hypothetical protein